MAGILDVLRHVVTNLPGLSDTNRGDFAEAVEDFGKRLVEHGISDPEPEPEVPADPQAARIAELEAELAAARAGQAPAQDAG